MRKLVPHLKCFLFVTLLIVASLLSIKFPKNFHPKGFSQKSKLFSKQLCLVNLKFFMLLATSLIQKTQEVKNKESQVIEKQQELKNITELMKRQPAIQQLKMIPIYQDSLKKKESQTQAMKNQLKQYHEILLQYEIQQQRLSKQLQNFKKKYYDQKKREQQQRQQSNGTNQTIIKVNLPDKRFTGGGFNLVN